MLKGIDVSEHQGRINWDTVKSQIDYAILRIGYGDNTSSQDDAQFIRNANECVRLGIPFGVYIYSYATSIEQAKSEAEHTLRMIKGYKLDYPIYYDLEDNNTTGQCSNLFIADMAETFANVIESNGYWCGMYASTYWWNNKLTDGRFNRWVKWVAQYASNCTYSGSYDMWQYASDGRINGISGNVDVNYCYVDYPSKISDNKVQEPKTPIYNVDYVIVYDDGAEIDKGYALTIHNALLNKNKDTHLLTSNEYATNCCGDFRGEHIILVGGGASNKFRYGTKLNGKDRYETANMVAEYIKNNL